MSRGVKTKWSEVPFRECQHCGDPIKKKKWKAWYEQRRFCSKRCSGGATTFIRKKRGFKTTFEKKYEGNKPSIEQLNSLLSFTRNYTLMAEMLGVHRDTILNWIGPKKELLSPRNNNVIPLGLIKKYEPTDRREYYRQYYQKNKKRANKMALERYYRLKENNGQKQNR